MSHTLSNENRALHFLRACFAPRKRPRGFVVSVVVCTFWLSVAAVGVIGIAAAGAVFGLAKGYFETTPMLDMNKIAEQDQTGFIYDGRGNLITAYSGQEYRIDAALDEIPLTLRNAYIAIEDVRFLSHNGVDLKRLVGVFLKNLANGDMQGGSTITQQLIKNTMLTTDTTYKRKLQEAYLAMQLETKYEKDEILEYYLNTIFLGGNNYGVKTAALDYFGKDLRDLTLRESAIIAGMTRNPNYYSPRRNYLEKNTPAITDDRANLVLTIMYRNNLISENEYKSALAEKVAVQPKSKPQSQYEMPYFVDYAITQVVDEFVKLRGLENTTKNRNSIDLEIRSKGYRIYTTVDPEIQHIVEDTLYNWEEYPALAPSVKSQTFRRQTSSGTYIDFIQPQAAAVVMDYHTGQLKAIVGGRQAPTGAKTLNLALSGQPVGSSIKPIAVYGPALDLGYSPAQPVPNLYVPIKGWDSELGYPRNFTTSSTMPMVTMRYGIRQSLNVVAAQVLMSFVGVENSYTYLTSLGIAPKHIQKTPFGLSLGSSGISPLEMAGAFGAIANGGQYQQPIAFTQVTDAAGSILIDLEKSHVTRQVFKRQTAFMLSDMLVQAVTSGTGTPARIDKLTVGGKTGTNSDSRGVTFAGFTPYYSASVWVGHEGYEKLKSDVTGGRWAAPIWQAFMEKIHTAQGLKDKPIMEDTPEALGLTKVTVCGVSGMLPGPYCELDSQGHKLVTDYFTQDNMPLEVCNMHIPVEMCAESARIATQFCPPGTRVPGAVVAIVNPNHPLYAVPQITLNEIYPGCFGEGISPIVIPMLDVNDPTYGAQFCHVHTTPIIPLPTPDTDAPAITPTPVYSLESPAPAPTPTP